jgi:hypothetical protein
VFRAVAFQAGRTIGTRRRSSECQHGPTGSCTETTTSGPTLWCANGAHTLFTHLSRSHHCVSSALSTHPLRSCNCGSNTLFTPRPHLGDDPLCYFALFCVVFNLISFNSGKLLISICFVLTVASVCFAVEGLRCAHGRPASGRGETRRCPSPSRRLLRSVEQHLS